MLLREQSASVSSQGKQSTSRAATPTPPTLSRPTHSRPTPQRSTQAGTQAGTRARATQRQSQQPTRMPAPQRTSNQARTVRADEFDRLTAQQQPRPQAKPQSRRKLPPRSQSVDAAYNIEPQKSHRSQAAGSQSRQGIQSARALLKTPGSLRQAMILKEILDVPVALRDDSIMAGSLTDC
jgi:hypothetical protein